MNKIRLLLIACAVVLAACRDSGMGPEINEESLDGLYYGTVEGLERGIDFTRSVNVTLSEDNDHVKGSFHVVGVYGRGTIAGKLSGRTLSFTFDQTYPCPGTFLGTASFTGDRVTGTYSGSACRGDVTASFEVIRTPEAVPL